MGLRCFGKRLRRPRRGFLLLSVLITLLVLSLIGASLHRMTLTAMRAAERNLTQRHLVLACETGADMAVSDLRAAGLFAGATESVVTGYLTANNRGWTVAGGDLFKTVSLSGGRSPTAVKVKLVGLSGSSPVAYVQSESADGSIWRQMGVFFDNPLVSTPGYGFIGLRSMNGGNLEADSYDSSLGSYASQPRRDGVTVGTVVNDPTKLTLGPSASVYGKIGFGGAATSIVVDQSTGIRSQSRVWNSASPADYQGDKPKGVNNSTVDKSTFVGGLTADSILRTQVTAPDASAAPVLSVGAGNSLMVDGVAVPGNKLSGGVYRIVADFNIAGDNVITIDGPVTIVVPKSHYGPAFSPRIQISGTGVFQVGGAPGDSLTLYTPGALNWSGNAMTTTSSPSSIRIISTATASDPYEQQLNFSGNVDLNGVVYAPYAQVNLSGNVDFFGSVIGGDVICSGNVKMHFDEALTKAGATRKVTVALVTELTGADRVARF